MLVPLVVVAADVCCKSTLTLASTAAYDDNESACEMDSSSNGFSGGFAKGLSLIFIEIFFLFSKLSTTVLPLKRLVVSHPPCAI